MIEDILQTDLSSGGSTQGPTGASAPVKMSLTPAVSPPELTEKLKQNKLIKLLRFYALAAKAELM